MFRIVRRTAVWAIAVGLIVGLSGTAKADLTATMNSLYGTGNWTALSPSASTLWSVVDPGAAAAVRFRSGASGRTDGASFGVNQGTNGNYSQTLFMSGNSAAAPSGTLSNSADFTVYQPAGNTLTGTRQFSDGAPIALPQGGGQFAWGFTAGLTVTNGPTGTITNATFGGSPTRLTGSGVTNLDSFNGPGSYVAFRVTATDTNSIGGNPGESFYVLAWQTGEGANATLTIIEAYGVLNPEPGSLILLGTGLVGLVGFGVRRSMKNRAGLALA